MPKHAQTRLLAVLLTGFLAAIYLTTGHANSLDDTKQQKQFLFEKLAKAQSEQEGRLAEDAIWQYWFSLAPDHSARKSLDAGMERRKAYDFEAAEKHLDNVVTTAPDYAEGYNQRAFVRFLRENFTGALTDLEKTLELEPEHFGALAGLYQVLRIQNRHQAAMTALQSGVSIHPWLKERGALPEELWPDSYRRLHEPGLEL